LPATITTLVVGLFALAPPVYAVVVGERGYPDGWERVALCVPVAIVMLGLIKLEHAIGNFLPNVLERVGDASYAMYLIHVPTLTILGLLVGHIHANRPALHIPVVLAAYAGIIAVGTVVFECVERPLTTRLRHGTRQRYAIEPTA